MIEEKLYMVGGERKLKRGGDCTSGVQNKENIFSFFVDSLVEIIQRKHM